MAAVKAGVPRRRYFTENNTTEEQEKHKIIH